MSCAMWHQSRYATLCFFAWRKISGCFLPHLSSGIPNRMSASQSVFWVISAATIAVEAPRCSGSSFLSPSGAHRTPILLPAVRLRVVRFTTMCALFLRRVSSEKGGCSDCVLRSITQSERFSSSRRRLRTLSKVKDGSSSPIESRAVMMVPKRGGAH